MKERKWYEEWFDSPYYHQLYENRNTIDADFFISNLTTYLDLPGNAQILDLACGKGRHSFILAQKGFQVTGVDLSENSINAARVFQNEKLQFHVQDMRMPFAEDQFDVVLNLFTSFGYFDDLDDNQRVILSVQKMLKSNGLLVIDFMNSIKTMQTLISHEIKKIGEIAFNIRREYNGTHILKHIAFNVENKNYHFTEQVQALTLSDFTLLLQEGGFKIMRTFGSSALDDFNPNTSERLILIAKKS